MIKSLFYERHIKLKYLHALPVKLSVIKISIFNLYYKFLNYFTLNVYIMHKISLRAYGDSTFVRCYWEGNSNLQISQYSVNKTTIDGPQVHSTSPISRGNEFTVLL